MVRRSIHVEPKGTEDLRVILNDHLEFILCPQAARYLAQQLINATRNKERAPGPLAFPTVKTKRMNELRPSDIPPGLMPEDVAVDG